MRGRLKPGKPQGLQSAIRRELVLGATELDLIREGMSATNLVALSALGRSDVDLHKTSSKLQEQIQLANELRRYYINTHKKKHADDKSMVELFKILEREGVLAELGKHNNSE